LTLPFWNGPESRPSKPFFIRRHGGDLVYRTVGGLTSYEFTDSPNVEVGDVLDAVTSRPLGEMQILPACDDRPGRQSGGNGNVPEGIGSRFEGLLEVDRGFPEGTPLFKDGKLVGMTIVGTRFLQNAPNRSYALPVGRMAALCRRSRTRAASLRTSPRTTRGGRSRQPLPNSPTRFDLSPAKRILEWGQGHHSRSPRGPQTRFKPANIYWIKGTYTLSSHDRALLLASTTATEPGQGVTRDFESQRLSVNRGTGGFALFLPMSYTGFPPCQLLSG